MTKAAIFQRKRWFIFQALTLIVLVPTWQPAASEGLPEKVAGFTPRGWQIFDRVKQYTPENLYEQIDGRASLFLAYDVVRLTFVSFVNNDPNGNRNVGTISPAALREVWRRRSVKEETK